MVIEKSTLSFLSKLDKNNTREWFESHRAQYEAARDNVKSFAEALISGIAAFDPTVADNTAREAMFRINRDVRFSNDKSPYKTNFGASIKRGGKKSPFAGYYVHIQPGGKSFVGGGLWMPEASTLAQVRQEIDYCFAEFSQIVKQPAFRRQFGDLERDASFTLSRPPKNYEAGNPAIEYLKLKCFVATRYLSDEEVLHKNLLKECVAACKTLQPLLGFLNRAIEG